MSSYEGDPYVINEEERASRINQFKKIQQLQHLERAFVIKHRSGSIDAIRLSSEDPLWAVNMKKAMATHLQLDVTGLRPFTGGPFRSPSSNLYAVHEVSRLLSLLKLVLKLSLLRVGSQATAKCPSK